MTAAANSVLLDLASLPDAAPELLPETLLSLAKAASVALEARHGRRARDPAEVQYDDSLIPAEVIRAMIDVRAFNTYDDPQEAIEEGAEGMGILVARRVLGRVAFRRLPKRTGADYFMRDASNDGDDTYQRLECSGIGDGAEPTTTRLRRKDRQLERARQRAPGISIVTNFGADPVEVAIGTVRR